MTPIGGGYKRLLDSRLIRQMEALDTAAPEDWFDIAFTKGLRFKEKLRRLAAHKQLGCAVICSPNDLGNVSQNIEQLSLLRVSEAEMSAYCESHSVDASKFDGMLIILTNNNLARIGPEKFAALCDRLENTVIAIHDFDNHHWHSMSAYSALYSDLYFPAHHADLTIQTKMGTHISNNIPCGTLQWSRDFLDSQLPDMISIKRKESPLGRHNFYPKFEYRNKVITTISKHIPSVGFVDASCYHETGSSMRWNEWIGHSCHWIVPTKNDLPIRFFDALITGGIPIIPDSLKTQVDSLNIPAEYYESYAPIDVIDPIKVANRAHKKYISLGRLGSIERHIYTLKNFHLDAQVLKIYREANQIFSGAGK